MNNSRIEKLAPLSGVVAVVLMIIGAALIGALVWLPSADRAVEIFSDNPIRVSAGGFAGLISAIFLIWFAGSVYSALREQEGGTGRLSLVAFGGGVASAIVLAAGFSFIMVAGARAEAGGGISPVEAVTMYDLFSSVFAGMFSITMVVFIEATAVVSMRNEVFPSWFGWASALIAFGLLLLFIGYIVLAPALVWMLVVSIWLYRRGTSTE
jgi:hypothetical protein